MSTVTYDDGSTIDTVTGDSTQSPPGYLLSDYSSNFAPSNLASGASSMMDVLKYGFGRIVDYKTASLNAQNTPPQYGTQQVAVNPPTGQVGMGTILLIIGTVLAVAVMSQD